MHPAVLVLGLPVWIASSFSRSFMVISPAPPSPTFHSPRADLTSPTGVITAAVPQAKTSLIEPSALLARHSSVVIRVSPVSYPRSAAICSSESG